MLLDRGGGEGGGGGVLGDGCTLEGALNEFSRTLIKCNNFKEFTQTKAFLWAQELNNCVFGSDIDQFLCIIHQKRTLINI